MSDEPLFNSRPYYEDEWTTIYHGDCRDLMPGLSYDIVVTDPPYGMGHYPTDTAVFTATMLRHFVEHGTTAIFGYPEKLIGLCVAAKTIPDEWVTWWPTNAAIKGFNPAGLLRETEAIAIFGAHLFANVHQPRTAPMMAHGGAGRRTGYTDIATRRCGDVWTDHSPGIGFQSHRRLHPNEKPLAVMSKLVQGMPSGVVLDPFMGSGTTLRAAKDLNRPAIGIDIDERYCEIAVTRLAQGVLDLA